MMGLRELFERLKVETLNKIIRWTVAIIIFGSIFTTVYEGGSLGYYDKHSLNKPVMAKICDANLITKEIKGMDCMPTITSGYELPTPPQEDVDIWICAWDWSEDRRCLSW